MSRYDWRPYVPVAERRQRAAKKLEKLRKGGRKVEPIVIDGRKIATTFWGRAWCENLEAYSDFENRLPRGRTYVRNGSVIDLQIQGGRIAALVSGSEFYQVDLRINPLTATKWKRIRKQCAGQIDSLVELLGGRLSDGVMGIVTQAGKGLFPTPEEIHLDCSCPDWATMCKHVAAVLYGVGARLDHAPEMLFALRGVDPTEMVSDAVGAAVTKRKAGRGRVLSRDDLSSVFGVEIDTSGAGSGRKAKPARRGRASTTKKVSKKTKKKVARKSAARKKTTSTKAKAAGSKKRAVRKRPKKRKPPRRAAN